MNVQYHQAGTIAYSSSDYFNTLHGQSNSPIGLYELTHLPDSSHQPSWWPNHPSLPSSPKRPLAGLKVIDLTRVIAGPTITRNLAEMGASVMRVTSPHVPDFTSVHRDLNWGKWNCHLHLKNEVDREQLRQLILDADVVVDGYRPEVMDRLGFSREEVVELVKGRERGIVHVRENCYGWHGPWAKRSGWQGISDAVGTPRMYPLLQYTCKEDLLIHTPTVLRCVPSLRQSNGGGRTCHSSIPQFRLLVRQH